MSLGKLAQLIADRDKEEANSLHRIKLTKHMSGIIPESDPVKWDYIAQVLGYEYGNIFKVREAVYDMCESV